MKVRFGVQMKTAFVFGCVYKSYAPGMLLIYIIGTMLNGYSSSVINIVSHVKGVLQMLHTIRLLVTQKIVYKPQASTLW